MQIFWFTNRSFNDLCSTTQLSLANGIYRAGHSLTIIGPGPAKRNVEWQHLVVKRSSVKGLQSHSLGRGMLKIAKEIPLSTNRAVVAIVHWSLAKYLGATLNNRGITWMIMDRSPPADTGLLAKLQKRVWVKAWRMVEREYCKGGFVVSPKHHKMVEKYCKRKLNNIASLPAGVNLDIFTPLSGNSSSETTSAELTKCPISFVYHGRIDKSRGIINMVNILQKTANQSHLSKLTLIGEGNAVEQIKRLARETQPGFKIELFDTMPQEELARTLSLSTFGLLPMPFQEVWAVASPLKRSEYLACGLLIFGIDHSGHQLENTDGSFFGLFSQQELATKGVAWVIENATGTSLDKSKSNARAYAETFCSWDNSVATLIGHLESAFE